MNVSRWKYLAGHLGLSLVGFIRTLWATPGFATRLIGRRIRYFLTRRFHGPLATPDGFSIETASELISYWSFFIEREGWSPDWINALRNSDQPLVLDVGANAGLFTHMIWTLNPNTRLVVFEPLPKMAGRIAAWQGKHGAKARIHNVAVSNQPGTATFYVAAENDTAASLKPGASGTRPVSVQTTTLDTAIGDEDVLLVKIDVEGAECEVLAGAVNLLKRLRFLIIEAHTSEALQAIERQLGPSWKHRRVGGSDYLFNRIPTVR